MVVQKMTITFGIRYSISQASSTRLASQAFHPPTASLNETSKPRSVSFASSPWIWTDTTLGASFSQLRRKESMISPVSSYYGCRRTTLSSPLSPTPPRLPFLRFTLARSTNRISPTQTPIISRQTLLTESRVFSNSSATLFMSFKNAR